MIRIYAVLSYFTSAVVVLDVPIDDNLNWLIRLLFGASLTMLGYLLKKVADQLSADRKSDRARLDKVEKKTANHNLILKLWIEHLGEQLDSRTVTGGGVGRRATDVALANLLTALRGIQEEEEEHGSRLAG